MPEYEQLRLWEEYHPKVNDYVIWDKGEYGKDEGWVYFYDDAYITIETGVKPKPKDQYEKEPRHKMIHTLLLCHARFWNQLKYVKSRKYQCPEHYSECDD
tara:strand:- start:1327 stop:1626 length:300 start_codon:yes stop_codon:yes gene_type:complete